MAEPIPAGLVVALDALAARFGGTAYAVVQLGRALGRHPDVARVLVITQRGSIVARSLRATSRVQPIVLAAPSRRLELPWRLAWEAARLPRLLRRAEADVLVSLSGMVPRRPDCPVICLLANPVPYTGAAGRGDRLRRAAIARTRRYARATYVPSTPMVELVGAPLAKVVPLGVDHDVFRPHDARGRDLLYVADFYPHKRHDLVVAAWSLLPEPRPRLRLIGNPDVDPATFAAVRDMATDGRVTVEPKVSLATLLDAYRRARAVIVASEQESFSMPLAEAIASGVPAVVRDHPVLLETGGPGALVVERARPEAFASALERIVGDDALHARLSRAGREHGRRFSWDAMAAEIVTDARAA